MMRSMSTTARELRIKHDRHAKAQRRLDGLRQAYDLAVHQALAEGWTPEEIAHAIADTPPVRRMIAERIRTGTG